MKINSSEDPDLKDCIDLTVIGHNPPRAVAVVRDTVNETANQGCYAVVLSEQTKEGTWKKLDVARGIFDLFEAVDIAELLILEATRAEISTADILIMRENARMVLENAEALFEKACKRYDEIMANVVITDVQAIDTARSRFVKARYLKNAAERLLRELEAQTEF